MIPRVSVIVPVYNAEKYLRECLDSIANQTLSDIQVIMIDDGSIDTSNIICKEYVKNHAGFEYYYKDNGGTASARNFGLKYAVGEYIGFVDADDYIERDMFEKMYLAAKRDDCDILYCYLPGLDDYLYLEPGFYDKKSMYETIYPRLLPCLNEAGTFRSIDYGNCSRLYRRDLIEKNYIRTYEKSRYIEDLAFAFETTVYANRYGVIDEGLLYHYRPVTTSKTHSYSKDMWQAIKGLLQYIKTVSINCEYDFTNSINYAIFYFCCSVIRNELRNPTKRNAIQNISEAISDPFTQDACGKISSSKMNSNYKNYYHYIINKNPEGLYRYIKRMAFKKKNITPILSKIGKTKAGRIIQNFKEK